MDKWDRRFLDLARTVGSWSKDPSTKVGAVITQGKYVLSLGFNGFPPDVEDREEWLNNREEKYKRTIHAEINALCSLNQNCEEPDYNLCTLYVTPLMPCEDCAKALAIRGFNRVVCEIPEVLPDHWIPHKQVTERIFRDYKVKFICHTLTH